jgi:hypothetical protein
LGSSTRSSRHATVFETAEIGVLYLTGVLTVAALVYLAYVMIRPEKF